MKINAKNLSEMELQKVFDSMCEFCSQLEKVEQAKNIRSLLNMADPDSLASVGMHLLYLQQVIPRLAYVIGFHIGLTTRAEGNAKERKVS